MKGKSWDGGGLPTKSEHSGSCEKTVCAPEGAQTRGNTWAEE